MSTSSSLRLLITGGAGFIGAHLVRYILRHYPQYMIYNLDALTYAGDLSRLEGIPEKANYQFLEADLSDQEAVNSLFEKYDFSAVIHLAAESHVDRSIQDPVPFLQSNTIGTLHLLEAARRNWQPLSPEHCFYQISTDEVYGTLGSKGQFTEESPYAPRSPYAASKAAADHLVHAYANTYGLPTLVSHSSNNYGPFQYPEKLIPLAILNLSEEKVVPMYGEGQHIREWIHVDDHLRAIDHIFHHSPRGETYHISTREEKTNKQLLFFLAESIAARLGQAPSKLRQLIQPTKDRPGHDFRYSMKGEKIRSQLGWKPRVTLSEGLSRTIDWYLSHTHWSQHIRSKSYHTYYQKQYATQRPT